MPTHIHYPNVQPLEDFTSLIEEASLELQKVHGFLVRANLQPLLLFKEAHIYLKSTRNIVSELLTTSYSKEKKVTAHAFYVFLASLLDKEIQSWAKTKNISYPVRIFVRNPNHYPSTFAVYVNEQEIIQFNIFERWYGIRENMLTEEKIRETSFLNIQSIKNEIEKIETKIKELKMLKKKPSSVVRHPLDIYVLLFKRKTLNTKLEDKLSILEDRKKILKNDLTHEDDIIEERVNYYKKTEEYINLILPFFKELDYSVGKNKYNLY